MTVSFKVMIRPIFPKTREFTLKGEIPADLENENMAKLVFEMEQKLNELLYLRVHSSIE